MSLEAALAENTASMTALAAVLTQVVANQERLIAGQQTAIEKLESGSSGSGSRSRAKKEPAAAATETPAKPETPPPAAAEAPTVVTDDDIKAAAGAWMAGKSEAARKEAAKFLNEILTSFGLAGSKLTGPDSKLNDEQRAQALFFIKRKAAGLTVDFDAEYDFDGDPEQDNPGAEEDPLG